MKYGKKEQLNKKSGPEGPYKQNQNGSIHFGANKTFVSEGLSHIKFFEQTPLGENRNGFLEALDDIEANTVPFCDYLVIDNKEYYCCVFRLDAPSYCTPENCPYLEGVLNE